MNILYIFFSDVAFKSRMFVKRDDLPKPLPRAFRFKVLKNVRAVADCTEIKVISFILALLHSAYISSMISYFRLRLQATWTSKGTAIPTISTTVHSKFSFLLHLLGEHLLLASPLKDHALIDKHSMTVELQTILTEVTFLLVIVASM